MSSSKSSEVWLLLFAILALSLYIESASADFLHCRSGETKVVSHIQGTRDKARLESLKMCTNQGRIAAHTECGRNLFGMWKCFSCCAIPSPRLSA
ncbi:hypothetical protein MKW92_033493 [Papaver armeniacum]|nr:hypothetical protein MKW92_033493 [Papaver armeniacum]